ncbi:MAG: SMP-30/gluconolactonase/LRE family protein [Streptosporangiaceae bacterium]|nr:SMP-30/gluconolactonase/LRE family protein [Streptosporangiaceae bacterium]
MTRVLQAEVAVPAQCELAEGPIWDRRLGVLRWVDILAGHVHSFDPASGERNWFDAGVPVGAVGLTSSGGLVLALVDGFALLTGEPSDGWTVTRFGGFSTDRSAVRFNDGKPDPWGNFWAGTMAWAEGAPGGALYRLSPDGTVTTMLPDVALSNGLDWTDDRRTFYFADSLSGGVDAFDCDPGSGALGERRRFVSVPDAGCVPDGLTLDSEGCLWLAVFGSGELRRFTPDGRLDTVVRLPARQVTSAAFGGPGLGTLYITTARENFTEADRRAEPHAGDIFACVPGVSGRPSLHFAA